MKNEVINEEPRPHTRDQDFRVVAPTRKVLKALDVHDADVRAVLASIDAAVVALEAAVAAGQPVVAALAADQVQGQFPAADLRLDGVVTRASGICYLADWRARLQRNGWLT